MIAVIIKPVRLEGGFKRGGRIRVAECLRQIVPDRFKSREVKLIPIKSRRIEAGDRNSPLTLAVCRGS